MILLRRIVAEHRGFVVPLAVILTANLAAYALVVYPLGVKSASARSRAEAASAALRSAQADDAAAKARVASKARAEQELGTFYQRVLPPDLETARRVTYTVIPGLAQKANVQLLNRHWEEEAIKSEQVESSLGHRKERVVLQGEYENLRRFIYAVETAEQFVIIDDVTLSQSEANRPLSLTLNLSIYYRPGAHGA